MPGVKGMKWGVRKEEESKGRPNSNKELKLAAQNRAILKKNPKAHVMDRDLLMKELAAQEQARRDRNKKILIGVGVGVGVAVTVAAGAILYSQNKEAVDGAFNNFKSKFGNKKPGELGEPFGMKERLEYLKQGHLVRTKQDAVKVNMLGHWCKSDSHRLDPLDSFDNLDDNEVVVKAGTIFGRVSENNSVSLRDSAYVSFEEDDVNRYAAFLPKMWKVNGGKAVEPDSHLLKFAAKRDIISPSKKARVKAVADLILEDDEFAIKVGYMTRASAGSPRANKNPEGALKHALEYYNKFASNDLMDRNSYAARKYKDHLIKKGFNAIIDDNDAGRLAKSPMIIFHGDQFQHVGSTPLSKKVRKQAANSIKNTLGESFENSVKGLSILEQMGVYAYALP